MNVNNNPITGAGGFADRVISGGKSSESVIDTIKLITQHTSGSVPIITNTVELKQAELRGENYTVSDEQIVKAIERAIKAMQGKATNLEFTVHEKTKMIAVKVLNSESGEVIREIPPEKSLDFIAKLWEMAGILIDEKR
ncbi:flagellar protein FlaG [Paenibacillus prosopidis]|uniref:Flagellar protein FlaG n=1 Tax=Paenibacillus prosopidis TaxID=630520 RepID=A0A368VUA0_9BACL|nr:flagellar protein FlaG [Paenibacillus prosopidis]RCW44811.1 flagellar protein FlaG [Paenibacillus prosopidis]